MTRKNTMILMAGVLLAVGTTIYLTPIINNGLDFKKQSKNLDQYEESVKSSVGVRDIKKDKYCSHSNQKYSKGSLSCVVSYKFRVDDEKLLDTTKANVGEMGWRFMYDNADPEGEFGDAYSVLDVYSGGDKLICSYGVVNDANEFNIEIGCSGPAKWEWFPVREN